MKKVLLGMSGGVDSSVSAILLQKQGYEVIGLTMNLCENDENIINDAKKVCEKLNIKHYVLDLKNEFKKYVIDNFISCYKECKTPNPCVECNKYMKFGYMYLKAKELGCDYISTGHYAIIEYSDIYKRNVLKVAKNILKDQSYFLYNLNQEIIDHLLLPLGVYEDKNIIRKIALENSLLVANKKDSEDICFILNGNYKEFLEKNTSINYKKGNIVYKDGSILGIHNGLYKYTIGQRKGLNVSSNKPLYVLGFNKEKNELIVGDISDLYKKTFIISDVNWIMNDIIKDDMKVDVKIRYTQKKCKANIKLEDKYVKVIFEEEQKSITPGQSAVFYIDDILIGGGKII